MRLLLPPALALLACDLAAQVPPQASELLTVEWGEESHALQLPRAEELDYRVRLSIGIVQAPVGTVTMSAGVEPYRESVLLLDASASGRRERETAWMRIRARGDYKWYSMDATIESRVHPVAWPRIVYNFKQEGTRSRRRESSIGSKDGRPFVRHRRDTRTGAPPGTRIWKEPRDRELTVEPLDMLTAVYHARTMIRDDLDAMEFAVADKLDLWQIQLSRGERAIQETAAGRFDTVKLLLEPRPYPSDGEGAPGQGRAFEGFFGIGSSVELWVERRTGVPVKVKGSIPIGPVQLEVDAILTDYRGTPEAFQPLDSAPAGL